MKIHTRPLRAVLGAVGLLLVSSPAFCGWRVDNNGYHIVYSLSLANPVWGEDVDVWASTCTVYQPLPGSLFYSLSASFTAKMAWGNSGDGRRRWRTPWFKTSGTANWWYVWGGGNLPDAGAAGSISITGGGQHNDPDPTYDYSPPQYPYQRLAGMGGALDPGAEYVRLDPNTSEVTGSGSVSAYTINEPSGGVWGASTGRSQA